MLSFSADRLRLDRQPLGPALEAFVFGELTKACAWSEARPTIYHYRDKDQVEVDFVLEDAGRSIVAVEVETAATVRAVTSKACGGFGRCSATAFASGSSSMTGPKFCRSGNGSSQRPC